MDPRTRQLSRDVRTEPWRAIAWKSCRKEAAGEVLSQMIDDAIFENESTKAFELACVYRGLATVVAGDHVKSKAEACLGSALRSFGRMAEATLQMQQAEKLAGSCDDCLGNVCLRWAVVLCHQRSQEDALKYYARALAHFGRTGNQNGMCRVFLNRSWAHGYFHNAAAGFEDVKRAIGLITPDMPSRCFVTAAVNVLALAVCLGDEAKIKEAVGLVEDLKKLTKGLCVHAKARPMLRWIRGLGHERLGEVKEAVRALESAIRGLERFNMLDEQKAAMADLARIRRMGKQIETNERHIRRLIETCLRLETDPETIKILKRARRNPSIENLLAWRARAPSRIPSMVPAASAGVIG